MLRQFGNQLAFRHIGTGRENHLSVRHELIVHDLAGEWLDRSQIMDRYREIYRSYAKWGDDSLARRVLTGSILDRVGKAIGHSLPGWYDTHARMD